MPPGKNPTPILPFPLSGMGKPGRLMSTIGLTFRGALDIWLRCCLPPEGDLLEVRWPIRIFAAIVIVTFATMSFPVRALALSLAGDSAQGQTCNLHGGKCRHAAGQACTHTCHMQIPEKKPEAPSCPLHAANREEPPPAKEQPRICHMAPADQGGETQVPAQKTLDRRASVDSKTGIRVCQITACAPGDEIASLPGIEPTITCDPVYVSLAGQPSSVVAVRLPSPVSLDTGPPTPPPRS